jgi:hypothetical protein
VADFDQGTQKKVAARLQAKENPAAVVRECDPKPKSLPVAERVLAKLARGLQRAYSDLHGQLEIMPLAKISKHLPALKRGRRLIRKLIARATAQGSDDAQSRT